MVIDSIAANFRAETGGASLGSGVVNGGEQMTAPQALAYRSTALVRLGALLRDLAQKHGCAILVSNQVADRFESGPAASRALALASSPPQSLMGSSPPAAPGEGKARSSSPAIGSQPGSQPGARLDLEGLLSLDHQLRFFTGWGDEIPPQATQIPVSQTPTSAGEARMSSSKVSQPAHQALSPKLNYKTPSLGLVWANQIACRIALIKETASVNRVERSRQEQGGMPSMAEVLSSVDRAGPSQGGATWAPKKWRRWVRVVFAPWVRGAGSGEEGVEIEVWMGGVRSIVGKG